MTARSDTPRDVPGTDVPDTGAPKRATAGALFRAARGLDRALGLGLLAALGLLGAGLTQPLMTVNTLIIFSDTVTLLGAIQTLWAEDEIPLAILLTVFSVLFPAIKLILAAWLWYGADAADPRLHKTVRRIESIGRWSMLDVFVVALTVVAIEVSLVAGAATLPGLYFFSGAVVLSMLLTARIAALVHRAA